MKLYAPLYHTSVIRPNRITHINIGGTIILIKENTRGFNW